VERRTKQSVVTARAQLTARGTFLVYNLNTFTFLLITGKEDSQRSDYGAMGNPTTWAIV